MPSKAPATRPANAVPTAAAAHCAPRTAGAAGPLARAVSTPPAAAWRPLSEDPDACYLALQTRDARFDGRFFTGVTSTGIYCRPVCAVRAPKRENCRFFELAAQAEQAGFRPCLRCRPELAPEANAWSHTDATRLLATEATRWLDEPAHWPRQGRLAREDGAEAPVMARLASRLGITDRHLRRLFENVLGVSPLQYLQTRRLLSAKQLLTDTDLPITEVAQASGFASLRRFNAVFVAQYGLAPSHWRRPLNRPGPEPAAPANANASASVRPPKHRHPNAPRSRGHTVVRLGYRPPYDLETLGRFMAARAVLGLETVERTADSLCLTRSLQGGGEAQPSGWLQVRWLADRHQVQLSVSDTLPTALPSLIRRVRQWLDLDADPAAIDAVLAPHFGPLNGLRVPGALDGFELAVRAILGQQVTVAAARTLVQRVVHRWGAGVPAQDGWPAGLSHCFPTPAALAGQGDGQALCAELGALGVVRQRQQALLALARAVLSGELILDGSAPLFATLARLQALPGVGDWTAQYIAMRALRWPDAFPAGDVVLQNALGTRQPGSRPGRPPHQTPSDPSDPAAHPARRPSARAAALATEAVSAPWRPWRSYAVVRIWEHGAPRPPGQGPKGALDGAVEPPPRP